MAVVVIATMKAKTGKENDLLEGLKGLAQAVKENEKDTLAYFIHRSKKNASTFVVYEKYKDEKAMN